MRWLILPSMLLTAACGGGADTTSVPDARLGCAGFVGDRARLAEIEAIVAAPEAVSDGDATTVFTPLVPVAGTRIPLIASPTGAVFIFGGARVRNVDTCAIAVTASLRDMAGHLVSGKRPMDLVATGDGWASTEHPKDFSGYVAIPACPNTWSDVDIQEKPYVLELEVTDSGGRAAKTVVSVVPFCAEPDHAEQCLGTCKKGAF